MDRGAGSMLDSAEASSSYGMEPDADGRRAAAARATTRSRPLGPPIAPFVNTSYGNGRYRARSPSASAVMIATSSGFNREP